jgi:hypothetical protein
MLRNADFTAMLNLPSSELSRPAKLMFQPWYFSPNLTLGHHQTVIVLASGSLDVMLKGAAARYITSRGAAARTVRHL